MRLAFYILLVLVPICSFAQREKFPDVLDLRVRVTSADTSNVDLNVFSDLGAWHAYSLPADNADYGSFIGPITMDKTGKWIGNDFRRLVIHSNGEIVDLSKAITSIHCYPGLLRQELTVEGLQIILQLIFVSARESMIETRILNTGNASQQLNIAWMGNQCKKFC